MQNVLTFQVPAYPDFYFCGIKKVISHITQTTVLLPFFWNYPGKPVPEENLLDFMVQG